MILAAARISASTVHAHQKSLPGMEAVSLAACSSYRNAAMQALIMAQGCRTLCSSGANWSMRLWTELPTCSIRGALMLRRGGGDLQELLV